MTITLTLNCDNAAFEGDTGQEIARIFHRLADTVSDYHDAMSLQRKRLFYLHDLNGNKVGSVEVRDA